MEKKIGKKLNWRLRVMMAEREIGSATELKRRLAVYGYDITSSQLTRIVRERPERISTDFLDYLLAVLQCDISELLRLDTVEQDQEEEDKPEVIVKKSPKPQKKRIRRVPDVNEVEDDVTGPKVTAFPIPPRKLGM